MRTILVMTLFLTACSHEKEGFVNLHRVPEQPNEAKTAYQLTREEEQKNLIHNAGQLENQKE